jgi:hypothetical protein
MRPIQRRRHAKKLERPRTRRAGEHAGPGTQSATGQLMPGKSNTPSVQAMAWRRLWKLLLRPRSDEAHHPREQADSIDQTPLSIHQVERDKTSNVGVGHGTHDAP